MQTSDRSPPRFRRTLAAGADHVIAGAPLGADFRTSITRLEQLAPALIALT